MEGTEHQQVNSTVERALILLELVSEKGEGVALAELVKEVDLPKTTIYRLLETLKKTGITFNSIRILKNIRSV